jgi:hypothetical protein
MYDSLLMMDNKDCPDLLFIKEEKNTKMYNHDQIQFLVQ